MKQNTKKNPTRPPKNLPYLSAFSKGQSLEMGKMFANKTEKRKSNL